jgi:hypothetical protein
VGDAENRLASFISAPEVFAFSASSPFIRFSSETLTLPYVACQFEVGRTADPMLPGQLAECDSGFAFLQDRNDL